ncbi:hypothetical protein AT270_28705 [Bacillus cereus]|nr:hypothetical protein AT270_28705 [Bacillus cereus]
MRVKRSQQIITLLLTLCIILTACSFNSKTTFKGGVPVNIVKVEGGLIKGVSTDVGSVQVFKGIPFAGFTGGDMRWKEAPPVKPWKGVKVCDILGDQSMQDTTANPTGTFWGDEFYFDETFQPKSSENGLNLNIYTPAKTTNENLPVLVYIHGGGNKQGHASEIEFYASKLAEKGIVVVSVQYRLGMFGFLALPELSIESGKGVSGNYAVLDLIKSLKWVQKYIDGFGGNPKKVTIAGQSAGAMNVTALLRTPLADGLFKRVIIQSGYYGLLTKKDDLIYTSLSEKESAGKDAVTKAFGKEMTIQELRALPAEYYMKTKTADGTQTLYEALTAVALASQNYGYALDDYVFNKNSMNLMRNGALDGMDIMIGGTSDELTSMGTGPSDMSLEDFQRNMQTIYGKEYAKAYSPVSTTDAYNLFLRAESDQSHQRNLLSAEYSKAHNKNLHVYTYYFNHAPPGRNSQFYGSYHSSELWYFFHSLRAMKRQRLWTTMDYSMANMMSSYYANFVKTGNPNGNELPLWKESIHKENNSFFMRWFEGQAASVTTTPYPLRDAINRKVVMESYDMTERDFQTVK